MRYMPPAGTGICSGVVLKSPSAIFLDAKMLQTLLCSVTLKMYNISSFCLTRDGGIGSGGQDS